MRVPGETTRVKGHWSVGRKQHGLTSPSTLVSRVESLSVNTLMGEDFGNAEETVKFLEAISLT